MINTDRISNFIIEKVPVYGASQKYKKNTQDADKSERRIRKIQQDMQNKLNARSCMRSNGVSRQYTKEELDIMESIIKNGNNGLERVHKTKQREKINQYISNIGTALGPVLNCIVPGSGFLSGGITRLAEEVNRTYHDPEQHPVSVQQYTKSSISGTLKSYGFGLVKNFIKNTM